MKTGIFANTFDDARALARQEKLEDAQWFFISSTQMLFGQKDLTIYVLKDSAEYREDCHEVMQLIKERSFLVEMKRRKPKKIRQLKDLNGNLIRNPKK